MKKTLVCAVLAVAMVWPYGSAVAAAPSVSKVYRTYASYRYTVTADSGRFTAGPTQGVASTTGGCRVVSHRNSQGRVIVDGYGCTTPGTVTFTTPDLPACETGFTIWQDGVAIYGDLLNTPCPPPAIPAVQVVAGDGGVLFSNPANVAQSASTRQTIPSLDCTFGSDDPTYTYTLATNIAGVGPNRYVYYTATLNVTVPALSNVVVLWTCP